MKGKVVLGVLAVTGILALTSTVAQAGDGGKPSALTSFFVCHTINGANLGREVDVYSDEVGAGAVRTLITIGQAVLACAQAALFPPGVLPDPNAPPGTDPNEISPKVPDGAGGFKLNPFELKCYSVSANKKIGTPGLFTSEDALFGSPEAGIAGSRDVRLVCGPAFFTQ